MAFALEGVWLKLLAIFHHRTFENLYHQKLLSYQNITFSEAKQHTYITLFASRVGNFRKKNNSAEDGNRRKNGYLRRNSGCSAEQKALRIPFRTLPRKGKQLGIPFRWTKKESNSRNSFLNPSAEETATRNSFPQNQNISKTLGIPFQTLQRKRKQLRV